MAPYHHRQLFLLTIPTLAALLSYLWYKKKRIGIKSDIGDKNHIEIKEEDTVDNKLSYSTSTPVKILTEDHNKKEKSPSIDRSFSRSLSGVDSAPIDIILPREHRAKITPIISDEDLDLEIEKIKSMKNTMEPYNKFKATTANSSSCNSTMNNDTTPKKSSIKDKCTPTKSVESSPKKTNLNASNVTKKNSNKKINKNVSHQQKHQIKQRTDECDVTKNTNLDKTIDKSENKLCELKIEDPKEKKNLNDQEKVHQNELVDKQTEQLQRQSSERDSANHSPSDVMLASPSLSSISDNHSEGSSDSGKGGSEVATPPSRTPAVEDASDTSDNSRIPMIYEFLIPQNLVGKLIGANGRFVTDIHNKTNAHILVKKHPNNNKTKVCVVEGTQDEINNAIKMVREKFPLKRFPELSLEQVSILTTPPQLSLIADHIYLKLVEGVNNDTIVSCMVAPNHLFLQQPTHPTYPNLNILNNCMKICYTNPDSPLLPTPIPENTVCVAQSVGEWYRAMVLSSDEETNTSYVSFLDYGGYAYVENSNLRQIRGDFMLLPFQAAECLLANIRPSGDEGATWSQEAYTAVAELTKGAIIYTQVAEYTIDGIPLVLMYILEGPNSVIYLNHELVNRGYAELITSTGDCEGAVGGVLA